MMPLVSAKEPILPLRYAGEKVNAYSRSFLLHNAQYWVDGLASLELIKKILYLTAQML
jgi:hypothetical protein